MTAALERFVRLLGHDFRDPALLARALTHRSAPGASNERLEFLGDGLLNFVIGQLLYERHPDAPEGQLTYVRASLVREEALARLAERLDLGAVLVVGSGEQKSGVARRASVLADSLEAVLGAVFVDGGFDAARAVVAKLFGDAVATLPGDAQLKDAKTRLQEHLQGHGRPLPLYDVRADGPPHLQSFTVLCRLADGSDQAEGRGSSRKSAEQEAAEKMLALIGAQEDARA